MRKLSQADQIAAHTNRDIMEGCDPAEALQLAIDEAMPYACDDYKAEFYTYIIGLWEEGLLSTFIVARSMEMANG